MSYIILTDVIRMTEVHFYDHWVLLIAHNREVDFFCESGRAIFPLERGAEIGLTRVFDAVVGRLNVEPERVFDFEDFVQVVGS